MASFLIEWGDEFPSLCRHGALTIGNFDGVHRGHAALIRELRTQARQSRGPAVAFTFDPHPLAILRPEQPRDSLTTSEDRAELLQQLGADHVVTLKSTPTLFDLSAEQFFDVVVVRQLDAKAMIEGRNFGFGRNREGNISTLEKLCQETGIRLTVVPPVVLHGEEVSSSRVRLLLLRGQVQQAAELLGRPYSLRGLVGTGQKRGRLLGFPTANLEQVRTVVPGDGVYAGETTLADGRKYPSAIHVGTNPTFAEQVRKIEVHLLGYEGDLYEQWLRVEFRERIRETRTFAGVEELTEQLHRDREQTRRLLEEKEG